MEQTNIIINQLHYERTLIASNYAAQVMQQLPEQWLADYKVDRFEAT